MSDHAATATASPAAISAAAELQQLLLATDDITGFLDQLVTLASTVLPGDLFCGITMRRDRAAMTVARSDTRASQVDEIQYGYDEGPCLHSLATEPRAFGYQEQLVAGRFAEEASGALALAVRIAERAEMSAHLQAALASRADIDQALGIVMGQNRCTADEAFALLRTISQNRNAKLRDIAAEMITAVSGQPPSGKPRFS